jgi:hypothetical protein
MLWHAFPFLGLSFFCFFPLSFFLLGEFGAVPYFWVPRFTSLSATLEGLRIIE